MNQKAVFGQPFLRLRRRQHRFDKPDERMAYARAWYALQVGENYLLAPSKVIGYKDFDPEVYFANENKDGRKTEARLQTMSTLVNSGHPKNGELHNALSKMLAKFGQTPNNVARIAIIETGGGVATQGDSAHIQAIMELIVRLPAPSIEVLKRRVADL